MMFVSGGRIRRRYKIITLVQETNSFSVECKAQEKLNIWESLKQAEDNSNDYTSLINLNVIVQRHTLHYHLRIF